MRFLFRCALLGTVLTAFLIVLAIQRHSVKRSSSSSSSSTTVGWHAAPGYGGNAADAAAASSKSAEQKQHRQELPTNEDHEIRRLLLAGAASADETAPVSQLDGGASSAEMAPALMLRFPRFPPAIGGGGTSGAEMTLNVAIVLLVSLLSIAILITAICCVIIVALALDTSTARRWSARPSMAATSADFILSSWPDMATQYHQLSQSPIYRTPGLDKLFQQQQQQQHHHHHDYSLQQADLMAILHDAPVDTPPLTDDDYEVSDEWHGHVQGRGEHRQRRNSFTV